MPKIARPLNETPPEEVLREIRARHRAGLPMTRQTVTDVRLLKLVRFYFGGWPRAVAAAGLEPVAPSRNAAEHRPPRKRLVKLTEDLLRGERTSAELERMTGIAGDTIRHRRRRMGIVRHERRKKDTTWIAAARPLFGTLSDDEIARRTGVSGTLVASTRTQLGIAAFDKAEGYLKRLDQVSRREVLRRVRARARAGLLMRAGKIGDRRLNSLCDFHFGSWAAAVEAAGLEPEGGPSKVRMRSSGRLRPLTEDLLCGPLPGRVLEAMTGIHRVTIRLRRGYLGIVRWEKGVGREWLKKVRADLGKLPDTEIARRIGYSPSLVREVRLELGIPAAPRRSFAAEPEVRALIEAQPRGAIERALAELDARSAFILRRRVLKDPPDTQASIGRRLGITDVSVAARERTAVATVLALIGLEKSSGRGGRRGHGSTGASRKK